MVSVALQIEIKEGEWWKGQGHFAKSRTWFLRRTWTSRGTWKKQGRAETPTVLLWLGSSVNTALVSALGLTQLDLPSSLTGLRSQSQLHFPVGHTSNQCFLLQSELNGGGIRTVSVLDLSANSPTCQTLLWWWPCCSPLESDNQSHPDGMIHSERTWTPERPENSQVCFLGAF